MENQQSTLKLYELVESCRIVVGGVGRALWRSSGSTSLLLEPVAQKFLCVICGLEPAEFSILRGWVVQKCVCYMGMCISVIQEKGFLVTFNLEFGTITRCNQYNSVLHYLQVLLTGLQASEQILSVQSSL